MRSVRAEAAEAEDAGWITKIALAERHADARVALLAMENLGTRTASAPSRAEEQRQAPGNTRAREAPTNIANTELGTSSANFDCGDDHQAAIDTCPARRPLRAPRMPFNGAPIM